MLRTPKTVVKSFLGHTTVLLGVVAGHAAEAAPGGPHCVVELFTSQGCSSCPPADALLGRMARDASLLVLSLPIDYWDYIGWKDTLASPMFTSRQKSYSVARGDGQVYTPQVVVDGLQHAIGSDAEEINKAIGSLGKQPVPLSVELKLTQAGNHLKIEVGAGSGDAPKSGGLWLLRVARALTVAIGRGENAGRTVTYTNVVRSMTKVGDWAGAAASFDVTLPKVESNEGDSYAVLLQAGSAARPGVILAAAKGPGL